MKTEIIESEWTHEERQAASMIRAAGGTVRLCAENGKRSFEIEAGSEGAPMLRLPATASISSPAK